MLGTIQAVQETTHAVHETTQAIHETTRTIHEDAQRRQEELLIYLRDMNRRYTGLMAALAERRP
ncbi:MAG TPA: hypothetical protein VNM72_07505 [Blastocatellia bacterium]|nr:hypothetical protein [Blastocatellia bacterium]